MADIVPSAAQLPAPRLTVLAHLPMQYKLMLMVITATAIALVAAAPLAGGRWRRALRPLRRDHGRTSSPNSGWPMAAAAGALGIRLEKVGHYTLGSGRAPTHHDVRAARGLVLVAAVVATIVALPVLARRR